jgi:hypothetical protein
MLFLSTFSPTQTAVHSFVVGNANFNDSTSWFIFIVEALPHLGKLITPPTSGM